MVARMDVSTLINNTVYYDAWKEGRDRGHRNRGGAFPEVWGVAIEAVNATKPIVVPLRVCPGQAFLTFIGEKGLMTPFIPLSSPESKPTSTASTEPKATSLESTDTNDETGGCKLLGITKHRAGTVSTTTVIHRSHLPFAGLIVAATTVRGLPSVHVIHPASLFFACDVTPRSECIGGGGHTSSLAGGCGSTFCGLGGQQRFNHRCGCPFACSTHPSFVFIRLGFTPPTELAAGTDATLEAWVYNADTDEWKGPSRLSVTMETCPIARDVLGSLRAGFTILFLNRSLTTIFAPSIGQHLRMHPR